MFYLADFEWQQISTGYYNTLNKDKDLRQRLTKGDWKNTFIRPKVSRGRNKKILNNTFKELPNQDKTKRSGQLIEALLKGSEPSYKGQSKAVEIIEKEPFTGVVGNKKYLQDKQIREDINKKLIGLPAWEKNKILGMIQDGKIVSPKPKVVEKIVEKIITTPPPSTSSASPSVAINPKVVSTTAIPSTTQNVTKAASGGLGRKIAIGSGIAALGLGGAYALNKMRKSRSDKGKARGRYNR